MVYENLREQAIKIMENLLLGTENAVYSPRLVQGSFETFGILKTGYIFKKYISISLKFLVEIINIFTTCTCSE